MRTIPSALQTHINAGAHALVRLVKFTLANGDVIRFSESDITIEADGDEYPPGEGLIVGSIPFGLDGFNSSLDIAVAASSGSLIDTNDLRNGLWDDVDVDIYVIDALNPEHGVFQLFHGNMSTIEIEREGAAKITFAGLLSRSSAISLEYYSPMCRAFLGDKRCRIPILANGGRFKPDIQRGTAYAVGDFARIRIGSDGTPYDYRNVYYECTAGGTTAGSVPTLSATPGATVTDGGVTWTVRNAWIRYAQVDTVTNGYEFTLKNFTDARAVDGWFADGLLLFRSGPLEGQIVEVRDWEEADSVVQLFLSISPAPEEDDWVEIYPGCDRTVTMCRDKYDNVENFRGEPNVPGKAVVAAYTTNQVIANYAGAPSIVSGSPSSGTVTFASISIGAAAVDRIVVVVVHANDAATGQSIDSVEIAGSAANIHAQSSISTNDCVVAIASRLVTTGTTASIEVSTSGSVDDIEIEVYVVTGATSSGPFSADANTGVDPAYELAATIDTELNGIVIGGWTGNGDPSEPVEWLSGGTRNRDAVAATAGSCRVSSFVKTGVVQQSGAAITARADHAQFSIVAACWV